MNNENKTKHSFQSEVKQLLHLMIHSLYSNKEIFLRELISNASDAIEKLRFSVISNPKKFINHNNTAKIQISIDKTKKTLSIYDNGIGMTYDEVKNNLGTIAKSGTKSFLKNISNDKKEKNDFIGQFGVGFYSSFIIAKKVCVFTKHAQNLSDTGTLWESEGQGEYTIEKIKQKEYGTKIILYIKETEEEFLETWNIKNIVKKYSDHISIPVEIENYDEKTKLFLGRKLIKHKAYGLKIKKEISAKSYQEFYKYITHDSEEPLLWSHNKVEGNQEYTSLLYIPQKATWDMWHRENKHGLKLYVKHVYIMDDAIQFLPNYLRFVKGIIDSQDLPLNISREILQDNKITQNLRKSLTKRVLTILNNLSETDDIKYQKFWNIFGLVLKEGLAEDSINQKQISNLLRFTSISMQKKEQTLSLKQYINNMLPEQEKIYFITADSYESAINSPHLEIFREKNIDVLLLSDRVDEWMMNYLPEYENKKFQSVSKSDISLEKLIKNDKLNIDQKDQNIDIFIEKNKNILGNRVKDVRMTNRLINTPVMVLTDTNDMSTQMAKLFSAAGQPIPDVKYLLEINPKHPLIKKIQNIKDIEKISIWIEMLFEQAIFAEKGTLDNPHQFINRINKLFIS
ncbi:heat shock protein 90 [Buchnera aphidicola (Cinara tujafilina)]|uniref:Chaperone protein HtpG n=1 Tax=Buchnera aphidicola (Cinara tujafilina) TaxID=261317 RepID=F7WZL6_9GAMM|nr:molecular chaperone HtpG [Buchnera aphidicola]AEH39883.1 heat shock protein 90 [Buchnera aphidicola (Cinara tujafilina)]